jgi:hypothetical protein
MERVYKYIRFVFKYIDLAAATNKHLCIALKAVQRHNSRTAKQ